MAGAPAGGVFPSEVVPFGSGVAFTSNYTGLWVSDGTAAGTKQLAIPSLSTAYFYVSALTPFAGKLYFGGGTVSDTSLWVSDGTAAGTQALAVTGASGFGLTPRSMAALTTKLVLDGTNAQYQDGLWVSDGTAAGTKQLAVPGLNPKGSITGGPAGLFTFAAGREVAFVAPDATGQDGVWVTDGTVAGTVELPGAHAGTWGAPMAALPDGKLAFIAADASGTSEVWITDGTAAGTRELLAPGAAAAPMPDGLVAAGGKLLFDALDASGTYRLWSSDGTSADTSVLLPSSTVKLQDGNISISAAAPAAPAATSPAFAWTDTTTHAVSSGAGQAYGGGVSYLAAQLLWAGTDSVSLRANAGSVFLRGGPGNDALLATSGDNVLDGGTGSNFLIGATGADGGTDTFFIDARGAAPTWSTLTNFHPGDAVTLWGFTGGVSTLNWAASDGAAGYTGATIHSATAGAGTGVNGSVTFAGVSLADALSKFSISTGSVAGTPYLYAKYTG